MPGFKTLNATGSRDENLVSSISVPYYVDTYAEVWTVGSGSLEGLPEKTRSWTQLNNGTSYKVTVIYEGFTEDEDGDEPTLEETEKWGLDFDFSEEPLESHHNLEAIKAAYGGVIVDKKIQFPEKIPKSKDARRSGLQQRVKAGEKNIMFGVETYALLKARITRSFAARDIPPDIGRQIGKIFKAIPGLPAALAAIEWGDRDWMVWPPKIEQRGDVWGVSQDYLLSAPGGWPPEVYGLIER